MQVSNLLPPVFHDPYVFPGPMKLSYANLIDNKTQTRKNLGKFLVDRPTILFFSTSMSVSCSGLIS